MAKLAQKEPFDYQNFDKDSLPELLKEAENLEYDLRPLLYCLNFQTNPEQFCESLRVVYMHLAEYLLRYPGYWQDRKDMGHYLNHIQLLFETLQKVRNDSAQKNP